jgi:2-amino-4-hydroxy-6-hydroxymethyldihydropteridine diphosphokinase
MMNKAVIGFGSNVNPDENIAKAKKILSQRHKILSESEFVRTKPIGMINQNDFLNGAVLIETSLTQVELKRDLKRIENSLGRKKMHPRFGPRTIDLDILVWKERVANKDFYERDFIRQAVLQLLPNLKF